MNPNNNIGTLPKLYTAQGDVNKKWFVHFNYFNPATGKNERVRIFTGFAALHTYTDKLEHGNRLVVELTKKLQSGWCPFDNTTALTTEPNGAATVAMSGKDITQTLTKLLQRLNKQHQWREKTFSDYTSQVNIYATYLRTKRAKLHLRAVNEKEAQHFLQWLTETRKAGPTTRNKYRAVLRGLWAALIKQGDALQNPWREIPKLREHREGKLAFNRQQAKMLKDAIQKNDPWLWLVCSFQFHCFLRPVSEVRMLQVQDIDFEAQKVRVRGKHVKTHETKIKDVPANLLAEMLALGLDKLPPNFYIFGSNGAPGLAPISKNVFYKRHSKIQKALGIGADFSLYSWKHTGNVFLYRKFKDLKMNQAINNHSDISTTDIYLRTKGAYDVDQVRNDFPAI